MRIMRFLQTSARSCIHIIAYTVQQEYPRGMANYLKLPQVNMSLATLKSVLY
jgi:hypothetical protein